MRTSTRDVPAHRRAARNFRCWAWRSLRKRKSGKRTHKAQKTRKAFKTSLSDLEAGEYVVRVDHGVGIYRGLTRMGLRGVEADYLLLEYAGQDKLYLPVTRINLVQRFAGAESATPRIDKLGGTGSENTKQRVKKAILAMAGELLTLYAKRELAQAPAFEAPDSVFHAFEAEFPFDETPDQAKATPAGCGHAEARA